MPEIFSHSPAETEAIAAKWAMSLHPGQTVLLHGELGAGKTCFVRGIVLGRQGHPDDVSSPSFSLVNEYQTPLGIIYHWDLYRLPEKTDWSVLDLDDHLNNPASITVIEWPERRNDLTGTRVHLEETGPDSRKITIK